MANEYRKPKGRPQTWPTQITAPPLALQLYKLIAQVQRSDAFQSCHIYHGASLGGEPMIKFEKKTTKLAHVVASYIGLPSVGRKSCDTPGCCNPFHYVRHEEEVLVAVDEPQNEVLNVGLDEWIDLVEYYQDKYEFEDLDNFDKLRAFIPNEDLSDDQLVAALNKMKENKDA